MRKTLIFMLLLGLVNSSRAQFQLIKLDEVELIKNSKLIVGLTGDKNLDEALSAAVKEFWTIGEIGEPMAVEEALKKAREDNSITVIKIGSVTAMSLTYNLSDYWGYRYINSSKTLELYNGKKKAIFKQFIPDFGPSKEVTPEILQFGVAAMHYQLKVMQDNSLSVMKIRPQYKLNTPLLKDLTLLLPEGWMDEKTTAESVKYLYASKAYIVSYVMWKNAIMNREEGLAYSMICKAPMGKGYVYQHYLMEAKTGNVLAVYQSKVAVNFKMTHGKDVNLTKGNSGYINKKILENYNKALEGKW